MSRLVLLLSVLLAGIGPLSAARAAADKPVVLRVGHFPNVTHAQGLIAHHLSRQGRGWFEERLGPGVKIEWFVYNAGPSAMEAILAGSLDITYVGPNPAINAHLRSKGDEIRVIGGAAEGGAALVVHADGAICVAGDFRGKRIATPQFGNTQDVSCRAWLHDQGFKVTQTGGDVQVIPTANPDQLSLFQKGTLDAVWTVEPWVSRLEMEANGKVFLEEKQSLTTILTCSARFLKERPQMAKAFARANAELTDWIQKHPAEAQKMVQEELSELTKRDYPPALVERSWKRLVFTSEIRRESFEKFLAAAQKAGFLRDAGGLDRLVEVPK